MQASCSLPLTYLTFSGHVIKVQELHICTEKVVMMRTTLDSTTQTMPHRK